MKQEYLDYNRLLSTKQAEQRPKSNTREKCLFSKHRLGPVEGYHIHQMARINLISKVGSCCKAAGFICYVHDSYHDVLHCFVQSTSEVYMRTDQT